MIHVEGSVAPSGYQDKWDAVYSGKNQRGEALENDQFFREWHLTTQDLLPTLDPYLEAVKGAVNHDIAGTLLDCGCGGSSIGVDLSKELGLHHCLLFDISPVCGAMMHDRYGNRPETPLVSMVLGDCRRFPLADGGIGVIVEKGTIDALESDADKVRTLEEFARLASKDCGLIISVAFPSVTRMKLLSEALPELGLQHHVHIMGSGDPIKGHDVRIMVCAFHESAASVFSAAYQPSAVTNTVLERVARTGSMLDDGEDPTPTMDWLFGGGDDSDDST